MRAKNAVSCAIPTATLSRSAKRRSRRRRWRFIADVIVVGAGAAGLAAAYKLATSGLRVVVVEARDRVGGRVWSGHQRNGVSAELGAEFIHGRAEDTMALLRHAGMRTVEMLDDSWICIKHGELQRDDLDFLSAAKIFDDTLSLSKDESVERFLQRFAHDPARNADVELARAFVEGFDAADPAIASAKAIADEWRSGVDFSSTRPSGGYRQLFEYFARDCVAAGAELKLSTRVCGIEWSKGGVKIDISDALGAQQTLDARAAIVTLPVGVLRTQGESAVGFAPGLPQGKRAALQFIEMGHAIRVGLWFRSAFWERLGDGRYRDAAFFRCAHQHFNAYWTQLPTRSTLIVAWAGGPKAIAMDRIAHSERVQLALRGFGELFDQVELTCNEFESAVMHDWDSDPYALGAYSYIAVGGESARAILAQPVDDKLFFAGEATSTDGQGGTVSGAFKTGTRAAREALSALGLTAD